MADPQNLPIDIPFQKLNDWLVNRKKIDTKWQTNIRPLRERIEDAAGRIPEDLAQVQALLKEPTTHYFHCKEILFLLEERLGDQAKNFLGLYKDNQLKEWSSIVSAYEKKNLFLADATRILERNTLYEIPALKNNIQKNEKEAADIAKKTVQLEKTIEEWERKFADSCAQLGITGNDLRGELLQLKDKLPAVFERTYGMLQQEGVTNGIELYNAFCGYMATSNDPAAETPAKLAFLSASRKLSLKARATTTKQGLEASEEGGGDSGGVDWDLSIESAGAEEASAEVDWGITASGDDAQGGETGEVNWDITPAAEGDAEGVDWDITASGDDDTQNNEAAEISWDIEDANENSADINWDFEVTDKAATDQEPLAVNWDITPAEDTGGASLSQAGGASELDMLDKSVRNSLLDDLMELKGFLSSRMMEMRAIENEGASMWFRLEGAPAIVQSQSLAELETMMSCVDKCIGELSSPELHELVMISQGGKMLDRMVEGLQKKKSMGSKLRASINRIQAKRSQLKQETGQLSEKLELYVTATKSLKKHTEEALSKQYQGRVVNIVGDINFI